MNSGVIFSKRLFNTYGFIGAELFLQGDGDRTLSMPSEGKDHRKFLKVTTGSLVFVP